MLTPCAAPVVGTHKATPRGDTRTVRSGVFLLLAERCLTPCYGAGEPCLSCRRTCLFRHLLGSDWVGRMAFQPCAALLPPCPCAMFRAVRPGTSSPELSPFGRAYPQSRQRCKRLTPARMPRHRPGIAPGSGNFRCPTTLAPGQIRLADQLVPRVVRVGVGTMARAPAPTLRIALTPRSIFDSTPSS